MGEHSVGSSTVNLVGRLLEESGCKDVGNLVEWLSKNRGACEKGVRQSKEDEDRLREVVTMSRLSSVASGFHPRRDFRRERSGPRLDRCPSGKPPLPHSGELRPNSRDTISPPPSPPPIVPAGPSSLFRRAVQKVDSVFTRQGADSDKRNNDDIPLLVSISPAQGLTPNPFFSDVDEHDEVGESDSEDDRMTGCAGSPDTFLGRPAIPHGSRQARYLLESPPTLVAESPVIDAPIFSKAASAAGLNPVTLNLPAHDSHYAKKRRRKKRKESHGSARSSMVSPASSLDPLRRPDCRDGATQTDPLVVKLSDIRVQEGAGDQGVLQFSSAAGGPCPRAPPSGALSPKASHREKGARVAFSMHNTSDAESCSLPSPPRTCSLHSPKTAQSPISSVSDSDSMGVTLRQADRDAGCGYSSGGLSPRSSRLKKSVNPKRRFVTSPPPFSLPIPAVSQRSDTTGTSDEGGGGSPMGENLPRPDRLRRNPSEGILSRMSRSSSLRLAPRPGDRDSMPIEDVIIMKRNGSWMSMRSSNATLPIVQASHASPAVPTKGMQGRDDSRLAPHSTPGSPGRNGVPMIPGNLPVLRPPPPRMFSIVEVASIAGEDDKSAAGSPCFGLLPNPLSVPSSTHLGVGGGGGARQQPASPSLSVLGLMDHVSDAPHAVPTLPPLEDMTPKSLMSPKEIPAPGSLEHSFRGSFSRKGGRSTSRYTFRSGAESDGLSSLGMRSSGSTFMMNRRGSYTSSLALRARLSLAPADRNDGMTRSDYTMTEAGSPRMNNQGRAMGFGKSLTSGTLELPEVVVSRAPATGHSREPSECAEEDEEGGTGQPLDEFDAFPSFHGECSSEIPKTEGQIKQDMSIQWFERFDTFWVPIVSLYSLYQLITIPARIGLDTPSTTPWIVLDLVMDLIFWAEIVLRMSRPIEDRGMIVAESEHIKQHYIKGYFWWDVITCIPLEVIGLIFYAQHGPATSMWRGADMIVSPLWRLNRLGLVRYSDSQFAECFKLLYAGHPLLVRASRTFWAFVLLTHYVACCFLALHFAEGKEVGMRFSALEELYTGDVATQYFLAYDYCVKAMVGMGRPGKVMPQTDVEAIFCILQAVLGVAIYAAVLSTISNLIVEHVSDHERWRQKVNQVRDVMQYIAKSGTNIPEPFSQEVMSYYHHDFWTSRVLLGSIGSVMGDLPPRISRKIETVVGGETLSRVPMFRTAIEENPAFLHFMLSKLEPKTFCEGELVMRKGEEGDLMYFVMAGALGVWSDQDERFVFECRRGSSLGEIALLHDCRRTASVYAIEMCSAFVLSRSAFEQAEQMFPTAISHVRKEADFKLQKIKLGEIVAKVPLFAKYADDVDFINDVVGALVPQVQPQESTVVVKGEIGEKMYFVSQGQLKVLSETGRKVGSLGDGSFFGEICVLFDSRRTATIVADTHVVLFTLSKTAFKTILVNYPEQAQHITEIATVRYRNFIVKDLLKTVPCFAEMLDEEGHGSLLLTESTGSMTLPPSVSSASRRITTKDGMSDTTSESETSEPRGAAKFLDALAVKLKPRSITDDECIFTVGQPVTEMIFVSTGTIAVISENDVLTECLEAGDLYGAMALIFFHWCPHTLIALRPSVIYTLSLSDFRELLSTYREAEILRSLGTEQLKRLVFERLLAVTEWGVTRSYFFKLLSHCRMAKFAEYQMHSQQTRDTLRSIRRRSQAITSPKSVMS